MRPLDALQAIVGPNATPGEIVKATEIRQLIRSNIMRAGEGNLERVQRERSRKLPPLNVGDTVLFSVEAPRKMHSAAAGMYAELYIYLNFFSI